jgi:hypothetical protein
MTTTTTNRFIYKAADSQEFVYNTSSNDYYIDLTVVVEAASTPMWDPPVGYTVNAMIDNVSNDALGFVTIGNSSSALNITVDSYGRQAERIETGWRVLNIPERTLTIFSEGSVVIKTGDKQYMIGSGTFSFEGRSFNFNNTYENSIISVDYTVNNITLYKLQVDTPYLDNFLLNNNSQYRVGYASFDNDNFLVDMQYDAWGGFNIYVDYINFNNVSIRNISESLLSYLISRNIAFYDYNTIPARFRVISGWSYEII